MKLLTGVKVWLMGKSLDLRMGKCSGFPNCCILWYVTGWSLLFGDKGKDLCSKSAWRAKAILRYHEKAGASGYVPCPLCLLSGARVRVRYCTDACGHHRECHEVRRRRWARDYP